MKWHRFQSEEVKGTIVAALKEVKERDEND
jgi:hypothetical protein